MKKTLFIHIGSHKTGTSAIQTFLSTNREVLRKNGYLYPGQSRTHQAMVKDFLKGDLAGIRQGHDNATRHYFDEIRQSGLKKIVLSSEGFELLGDQILLLRDFLSEDFDVRIIFYVRRQDEKIESAYNRSVKNPRAQSTKTFLEFLQKTTEVQEQEKQGKRRSRKRHSPLDYYEHLRPWSDAFGRDHIIVRCYENEQLPKGIFHDFLDAVGLTLDERYRVPKTRINQSLDWDLIEIVRMCNAEYRNDRFFHEILMKHLKRIAIGKTKEKQHLLSPKQRNDLIAGYDESNAKVAREYLGRSDGRLFYAPLPDEQESWEPYEGLTVVKLVPVFTQMLYRMETETPTLRERLLQIMKNTGARFGLLPVMRYWYYRFFGS